MAEAVARANCGDVTETPVERWQELMHFIVIEGTIVTTKKNKSRTFPVFSWWLRTAIKRFKTSHLLRKEGIGTKIGSEKIVDIAIRLDATRVPGGNGRAGMPVGRHSVMIAVEWILQNCLHLLQYRLKLLNAYKIW